MTLLDAFFAIHDPTSQDRQGSDAGRQYRSAIFFHSDIQQSIVDTRISQKQHEYTQPIVTQVRPAAHFWLAE